MNYKQIDSKAIKIVGMGGDTSIANAPKDCMLTWMNFMQKFGEVEKVTNPNIMYGVCFTKSKQDCTFHYIAGVEVSEFGEAKDGFEQIDLPATTYLVFTHKGKLDTLGQTYDAIMKETFNSGKKQKEFWIEYYDERYDKESNDSEFDIWIAIE